MDLFTAVELFTQVITYLTIVAGFPSCINMLKTKVTKGVPYVFFLVGTVNSTMCICYGSMVNNSPVIQINVFATICNIICIVSFIWVSQSKRQPVTQLLGCTGIVFAIYLYITRIADPSKSIDNLGVVMLMSSIVMLLTPLLAVKQCIDERSAAHLPLSMMVPGILCSVAWLMYGYLLNDIYIYGPNIIGLISYMCQLVALVVYGTKPFQHPHDD